MAMTETTDKLPPLVPPVSLYQPTPEGNLVWMADRERVMACLDSSLQPSQGIGPVALGVVAGALLLSTMKAPQRKKRRKK